jgi:hypothetical protein
MYCFKLYLHIYYSEVAGFVDQLSIFAWRAVFFFPQENTLVSIAADNSTGNTTK